MKKILLVGVTLFTFFFTFSQNNTINYKALLKDNSGNILSSQSIDIRFTIFVDAIQVYQETQNATTDTNGIIIANIGAGTTSDTFTSVNWNSGTSTFRTEIDSGSGYVDLGTSEFKSVPYALNVSGLTEVTENGNTGWRLETNPNLDGGAVDDIGDKAIDMTIHDDGDWFFAGASGAYSFAVNKDNYATGNASSAFGTSSSVGGANSISAGSGGSVNGNSSFGFGNGLQVSSNSALAIGDFNFDDTNAVFMIGNGTNPFSGRANALTVYKTGKTTVQQNTSIDNNDHALNGIKTFDGSTDAAGVYGENIVEPGWGTGVKGRGNWLGVEGIGGFYGVYGDGTSHAVYANGNLTYTGILNNASDRKLKTNIKPINNVLEVILQLNPTTYNIKQEYIQKMNMSSKPQIGFIAQELQQVFPNLVSQNIQPAKSNKDKGEEYLSVNYIGLIPILTAGIKEQQQIIDQQQETIDAQQQLLQQLLERVEALENRD